MLKTLNQGLNNFYYSREFLIYLAKFSPHYLKYLFFLGLSSSPRVYFTSHESILHMTSLFPRASSGKSGVDQLHPTMLSCLRQGDLSKVVLEGLLLCIKNLKISNPSDPKSCKFLSLKHEIFYFNPSFFYFVRWLRKPTRKRGALPSMKLWLVNTR